ncbi:MAG: galactokinase family protein [Gemmatimonadales bacterium]
MEPGKVVSRTSPVGEAISLFQERFGSAPRILASAPGRLNLIGEHTDYNGGPVLPLAIGRRTAVAAGHAEGWTVVSALDGESRSFDPDQPHAGDWTAYLAGLVRVLRREGLSPRGAQAAVATSVPVGAGLSSSAALLVSAARALIALTDARVTPERLARLAYEAEHDEVGVKCGTMDQTIVALAQTGHALLYETGSGALRQLPFDGLVWIFETGIVHELRGGGLNQRRGECVEALSLVRQAGLDVGAICDIPAASLPWLGAHIPPPWSHRVRHVVTETARVHDMARALEARDLVQVGRLLVEGHKSLRDDYQSSCGEADLLVDALVSAGAHGARLTGAGWGGAVIALLPAGWEAQIVAQVQGQYQRGFGRAPNVWSTKAAAGVRVGR